MKKIQHLLVTAFAAAAVAVLPSCKDDDDVKYVTGTLTIDESNLGGAPSPESYKVSFANVGTGIAYEAETVGNSLSLTELVQVVPGIYDIVASASATKGGMTYNYIGTLENVELSSDLTDIGSIKVSATKASALVFKEIHYNASKTLEGKSYLKDTFLEVYNNSEETVYLDGICLGDALSHTTYQFDGSASKLGTGNVADYIFIGTFVWQIPGNGTDYPLEPGESFIIAASAINHSAVAKTVDLSTAEFETICQRYIEKGGQVDANAINMNLACTIKETSLGNQLGMFIQGAWVLFYPSEGLRADGAYLESDNYANNYGQEVRKTDILDAVETMRNATSTKRLETEIDAGFVVCGSTGSNQSIVRKISGTNSLGFNVYKDTNNTTEDFDINDTPEIRRYGAKRPSWSTWTTAQ